MSSGEFAISMCLQDSLCAYITRSCLPCRPQSFRVLPPQTQMLGGGSKLMELMLSRDSLTLFGKKPSWGYKSSPGYSDLYSPELPAGKGSLLPHAVSVFPDNYPQAKMLSLLLGSESHEVLPNSTAKSESEGQAWFCLPLWLL